MNADPEKTPIKTFIRIKPSNNTCEYLKTTKETLTLTKTSGETMQYTIDTIFNEKTSQSKIFEHIKPILKNVVKGINSTVFCYGNTGSGKTYTMFGTDKNPGIVHNFVNHMFDYFNSIQDLFDISVVFSYFQIYNEKVFDMFTNEELCLREFKDEVMIKGLTEKAIDNEIEFKNYFEFANKNKKIGSTTLNEFSSRSHTIIRLDCTVDNKKSHVYLIDLAGSENNRKTGNAGIRLLESTNINKSLFILNQVVNAILNKSPSIPYRDSKLTRVLKDSLGGNSVCYILGCIEPKKMEETLRTLEFVSKSRKIICDVKSVVSAYISEKKETVYDKARKQIAQKDNGIFGGSNVHKPFTFGTVNQKTFVSVKDNAIGTKKRVILGEKDINTNNYKIDKDQKIDKSYITQYHNDSSTFSLSKTIIDSSKESGKSKNKVQIYMSKETLLKMLNSDNFIDIKKIKGIGDKRASDIIEYVKTNGKITDLTQLKSILSQKVYEKICKDVI